MIMFNLNLFKLCNRVTNNRLYLMRYFSQQTEVKEIKKNDSLIEKDDVTKLIPKDAKDNFLIEFHQNRPTYDQLFEYKIGDEEFNKERFTSNWAITSNMKIWLTQPYDVSFAGFKRFLKRSLHRTELKNQQYKVQRHGILGPDLATTHFILTRGGKVRFLHDPNVWFLNLKTVPNKYEKKYKLLSVDASNTGLIYEGLDNLILLSHLQELNLSGNKKLDDWACDKLARIFRNSTTLDYLNLSDLPLVTDRGIQILYKIPSLRTLVIKGTKAAQFPFIELLKVMFNEVNSKCRIIY